MNIGTNIELEDIKEFSKEYNKNMDNKKIEKEINQYGLDKVCLNRKVIKENPPIFNIELSETKRYDQKGSLRCWAFAGINVIKRNMASNLNIDIMEFELSDNFIAFFHRLEKANTNYERIISSKTTDLSKIAKMELIKEPVEETGNWHNFVSIVRKYGLVPMKVMPITVEGENATKVNRLFSEMVKKNIVALAELKKQNKNMQDIRKAKAKMLEEDYEFLSKVYGEPVNKFDYKYTDKSGKEISIKDITPNEFVKRFLSIDIENFIFISNVPNGIKKYGQKFKDPRYINVYKNKYVEYLHISSNELKELAVKQLKENIPVMVGIYIRKFADKETGVLDTRLYNYEKLVNYKKLDKANRILLGDIELHHWMTITGVQIEDEIPKRWKVEDSYGNKEKVNGYYIMNDNYFDEYVFTIIVHKKYLTEKQLKLYNEKSIME